MTWTEERIQKALVHPHGGIVPYTRYICVPNIMSGRFCPIGESDLIAVTLKGSAKEFEIKISVSDLKKDKHKAKHRFWNNPRNKISEFYYVIPEDIFKEELLTVIPEHAGLYTVKDYGHRYLFNLRKPAEKRRLQERVSTEDLMNLMRLTSIKFWVYWSEGKIKSGD